MPAGHLVHSAVPLFEAMVPGRQRDGCDCPPAQAEPGGHKLQSAFVKSGVELKTKNPGSHVAGMGEAEPAGQYEPEGHGLHALLPSVSSYVPLAHVVHKPMPSSGAAVARPQAAGAFDPGTQKWPDGQVVHSACVVAPGELW